MYRVSPEEDRLFRTGYSPTDIEGAACSWYALYVKSRHEFVAATELTRKGIEAFVPSVKKLSRWSDREKTVEFPLFPGYVFIRIPAASGAFLSSLKTRGVVMFVSLDNGMPTPVDSDEISSLKTIIENGGEFEIYNHLTHGLRVRVKRGPLSGAEGIIQERHDKHFFVVNIDILGRSVGVRISAEDIQPE